MFCGRFRLTGGTSHEAAGGAWAGGTEDRAAEALRSGGVGDAGGAGGEEGAVGGEVREVSFLDLELSQLRQVVSWRTASFGKGRYVKQLKNKKFLKDLSLD